MACRAKPASSPPSRAALAAPGRCRRRRRRPRDRGCPLLPNPRRAALNPRHAGGNGGRAYPDPNDGNGNLGDDSGGWRRLATVQTTATAAGDLDDDGGALAWVQDARRCSLRRRPALLRRIEEVVAAPAVALRSWLCTAAAASSRGWTAGDTKEMGGGGESVWGPRLASDLWLAKFG
uniref:Uncharacterized protein n=1 Tax=Oryza rufipogon TaxID=4529 RepID=A0A0E0PBU7_ORYRU